MHVLVLGAGVVGVTTAYYLSRSGHDVTVVDRASHVAAGASYANGGQLSYSFTDALANPAFLTKIPKFMMSSDAAVRISDSFNPAFLKWSSAFLRQCTTRRAQQNSLSALKLALRSSALLEELLHDVTLDFAFRRAGKLVLVRDQKSLLKADRNCRTKRQHGCKTEVLTMAEAITLEPNLAHMPGPYAGTIYSENDEVADARAFTEGLADWLLSKHNVEFLMDTDVRSMCHENKQVTGVHTANNTISADAVVMCAGAWSEALLAPLGLSANIYPVRGYSITLPLGDHAPSISLTDYEKKIVFSRMNKQLRIAGFADFVGFDTSNDSARIAALVDIAQQVAPHSANFDQPITTGWGGLRPMTPDGQPRIGPTAIKNLYLNTGHGMLGWTLACASGYALATALGQPTENATIGTA